MSVIEQERDKLRAELLAERQLSVDEYFALLEANLDKPMSEGLNMAHEVCDRWARDFPDRLAIAMYAPDGTAEHWTYLALQRASRSLTEFFRAQGLKSGDAVAAIFNQQIEAYICAIAAWRGGFVYVPLFGGFGVDAIAERLNSAGPKVVVTDQSLRAEFESARALLTSEPTIVTVGALSGEGVIAGDHDYWAEINSYEPSYEIANTSFDTPSTMIFTSGTTGKPKGCISDHAMFLSVRGLIRHVVAPTSGDVLFNGAGPGWAYGLLTAGLIPVSLGIPVVMCSGRFDPKGVLAAIVKERVTFTAFAPSAYRQLVTTIREVGMPESVRGGLSSGEPCDSPLARAWTELGGQPTSGQLRGNRTRDVASRSGIRGESGTSGRDVERRPGNEVVMLDGNGEVVTDEGELAVRKPR